MTSKSLMLIFVSVLYLAACTKRRPPWIAPVYQVTRQYFSYKAGSYWIYRDSLTGNVDSLAVTKNSTFPTTDSAGKKILQDAMDLCVFRSDSETRRFGMALQGNNLNISFLTLDNVAFSYPFADNYSYLQYGDTIAFALLTNCTLNNVTYDTIARISRQSLKDSLTYRNVYYFDKHTGPVRMELERNTFKRVWVLQRHYVVR